jgi:hypothetical protein
VAEMLSSDAGSVEDMLKVSRERIPSLPEPRNYEEKPEF